MMKIGLLDVSNAQTLIENRIQPTGLLKPGSRCTVIGEILLRNTSYALDAVIDSAPAFLLKKQSFFLKSERFNALLAHVAFFFCS